MRNIYQSLMMLIAGATPKELARQLKYLVVEKLSDENLPSLAEIRCYSRLSGLLKSYHRRAA